jgi:hypothetical protein
MRYIQLMPTIKHDEPFKSYRDERARHWRAIRRDSPGMARLMWVHEKIVARKTCEMVAHAFGL